MSEVVRLGIAEVERRLDLCRLTIWRMTTAGTFPQPHYILGKRKWFLADIEAWEREEMARERKPQVPPTAKGRSTKSKARGAQAGGAR